MLIVGSAARPDPGKLAYLRSGTIGPDDQPDPQTTAVGEHQGGTIFGGRQRAQPCGHPYRNSVVTQRTPQRAHDHAVFNDMSEIGLTQIGGIEMDLTDAEKAAGYFAPLKPWIREFGSIQEIMSK